MANQKWNPGQRVKIKSLPDVASVLWGVTGSIVDPKPATPQHGVDRPLMHFDFEVKYEGMNIRFLWVDSNVLEPLN